MNIGAKLTKIEKMAGCRAFGTHVFVQQKCGNYSGTLNEKMGIFTEAEIDAFAEIHKNNDKVFIIRVTFV